MQSNEFHYIWGLGVSRDKIMVNLFKINQERHKRKLSDLSTYDICIYT